MVDETRLSVLMTTYNRAGLIGEAIESVLQSRFIEWELIIVDDCSDDDTENVVDVFLQKDKRIRFYRNEQNLGDYPNRNRAASYARGTYIKYVDSDDKIYPHTLGTMMTAMETFPEAAFGFSDTSAGSKMKYPALFTGRDALRKHFLEGGFLQAGPSTSIIRRDAFNSIGGFSGTRYVSDYEAWLYLCLQFSVVIFEPGLVWIRTHAGQENDLGRVEYYHLNYNLHKDFIGKTDNPFTNQERENILYNYRILLGRRIYQRLLKWYGLKKTLSIIKDCGENMFLFIRAFFPMKKQERK